MGFKEVIERLNDIHSFFLRKVEESQIFRVSGLKNIQFFFVAFSIAVAWTAVASIFGMSILSSYSMLALAMDMAAISILSFTFLYVLAYAFYYDLRGLLMFFSTWNPSSFYLCTC